MGKILIADRKQAVYNRLRSPMEHAGYTVHNSDNLWDALALQAAEPIQAVIIDLSMPEMVGWMLLRSIRTQGSWPLRIALVDADPGFDRNQMLSTACRAGADCALQRHVTAQTLIDTLQTRLSDVKGEQAEAHQGSIAVEFDTRNPMVFRSAHMVKADHC
uniref:Putative Response regulator receiver protein n=1 Tax=Magnetococcus massalia (strain MO-1) TaxID=451514 RepID=A0A1S7LIU7_MAGMO|nr:putative Response regulator receiver protein [Candidatus Magnetococcus massalia]